MAIRELITKFSFTSDPTGINQYQKDVTGALENIKNKVGFIGKLIGAELAIQTVGNFVKGVADNIRASNQLGHQIAAAIAPGEDAEKVMDHLFSVAQDLGDEFVAVGQRFSKMVSASSAFGVSTDETMGAFENISKAMELNRLSGEATSAAWDQINAGISRGGLSMRTFSSLIQNAPKVIDVLAQNLGKTREQLAEMAKAGDITSDMLVKGFSKANEALNTEFMNKPDTLGEAFNYAYNEIVRAGRAIWKITYQSRTLAAVIRYLTDTFVSLGKKAVSALGGVDNVIRLIGISIAMAFGYQTIGLITKVIGLVRALTVAQAILLAKWAAIAAIIAAIALAIEDIYVWSQGGKSVLGGLIGRVEEWQVQFDYIKARFNDLKQVVSTLFTNVGDIDFSKFSSITQLIEELKRATEGIGDIVARMAKDASKGTDWEAPVTAATHLWEMMKAVNNLLYSMFTLDFSGMFAAMQQGWAAVNNAAQALYGYLDSYLGITDKWNASVRFVSDTYNTISTGIGNLLTTLDSLTGATDKWNAAVKIVSDAFNTVSTYISQLVTYFDNLTGATKTWNAAVDMVKAAFEWLNSFTFDTLKSALEGVSSILDRMATAAKWVGGLVGFKGGKPTEDGAKSEPSTAGKVVQHAKNVANTVSSVIPGAPTVEQVSSIAGMVKDAIGTGAESFWNGMTNMLGFTGDNKGGSAIPNLAPGDMATQPNIENNTQTNNVPINAPVNVTANVNLSELEPKIRAMISESMAGVSQSIQNQMTRSFPRMEAATGQ